MFYVKEYTFCSNNENFENILLQRSPAYKQKKMAGATHKILRTASVLFMFKQFFIALS